MYVYIGALNAGLDPYTHYQVLSDFVTFIYAENNELWGSAWAGLALSLLFEAGCPNFPVVFPW